MMLASRIQIKRLPQYFFRPRCQSQFIFQSRNISTKEQFEDAQNKIGSLSQDPGNELKLKMYGLFKQSTIGPVQTKRPGMVDFVGRAKWDAWNTYKDLDTEGAQKAYIELVNTLVNNDKKENEAQTNSVSSSTHQYKNLIVDRQGGLNKIILNRPTKMNALTFEMYKELEEVLLEAKDDPKTVVTVITGAGSYFCSGNDLSNFNVTPDKYDEVAEYTKINLKRFVGVFIDFPKPLIAVVNGPAVGIGVTLLGLCDAVYASDKATFLTPFSSLGQSPEGCSSVIFPRIMGYGKASEILLFNKKISATEAYERNLVTEVFPDEVLQKEIWPRLESYAKLPSKSLIYSKQLVRAPDIALFHKVNEMEWDRLRERVTSEDCMNAIAKFFIKKKKKN